MKPTRTEPSASAQAPPGGRRLAGAFAGGIPAMVAKVDMVESVAAWQFRPALILALVFGLVLATAMVAGLLWQRKSEFQRYARGLIEASLDPLVTISPSGKITDVNTATETVTGRSRSELIGTDFSDYFTEPAKARAGYEQAFLEGAVRDYPLELRHRDGSGTSVLYNATVYRNKAGEVAGVFAVVRDVTELKRGEQARCESEERFRDMFQQIPSVAIQGYAPDGTTQYWNHASEHLYGYTAEQAVGRNLMDLIIPPEMRDNVAQAIGQMTQNGLIIPPGELSLMRKDGSRVSVYSSHVLVKTPERPNELFCVDIDLTELKQAEAEIRQLNQDLEQRVADRTAQLELVNKELESFSYSVSHDLRAPLRSISGFSKALLEDCADQLDDVGKKYLVTIQDASQRMAQLIDDVLRLSHISRTPLRLLPVDLSALAAAVAEAMQKAEPDRRVEFTIEPGCVAHADASLLRAVLENLIGNAWKFTSHRQDARIQFGRETHDGRTAYFVRDNGVGFDMQYVSKLFGAFQRLHTSHEFPGTGIGLASVQRIIHRHGGKVWIEGRINEGATVYFTLPQSASTP